jgi:hypothetical protein
MGWRPVGARLEMPDVRVGGDAAILMDSSRIAEDF